MPKSAKEFLTVLLTKAGVKLDEEAITQALAVPELSTLQIPDSLITPIDNGLLGIQAAKNNHPEIQKHYKAQIYDGIDKMIARMIDEHKISDEVKADILAEPSSTKRIELLTAKLKEEAEKKGSAGKGEKDSLQLEITKLNNELREIKQKEQGIHDDYKKQLTDVRMGHSLGLLLGGYKTKFDELPASVKDSTLKAIINNSLATDGAEFSVDETGQVILRKKDGNNFFGEDHNIMTPKTYLDKILARDKILIVNDQNQNNGNGASSRNNNGQNFQFNQPRNQNNGNGNGNNGNSNAASRNQMSPLVEEALRALAPSGA